MQQKKVTFLRFWRFKRILGISLVPTSRLKLKAEKSFCGRLGGLEVLRVLDMPAGGSARANVIR